MPAIPPPMMSVAGFIGASRSCVARCSWAVDGPVTGLCFFGCGGFSSWTHEQCSRMLAIWKRYLLMPAFGTLCGRCSRALAGCMRRDYSVEFFFNVVDQRLSRVGAHGCILCYDNVRLFFACSTASATFTLPAMFMPQWRT